jgi:hypothetical protein
MKEFAPRGGLARVRRAWYRRGMKTLTYTIHLEPAEEGGYTVTVPALPGCVTEGDTYAMKAGTTVALSPSTAWAAR